VSGEVLLDPGCDLIGGSLLVVHEFRFLDAGVVDDSPGGRRWRLERADRARVRSVFQEVLEHRRRFHHPVPSRQDDPPIA
jgi:hypothetical protein